MRYGTLALGIGIGIGIVIFVIALKSLRAGIGIRRRVDINRAFVYRLESVQHSISMENSAMSELWLGNVDASATDDDIRDFLCRYGFAPYDSIKRVTGTGARPAAVVTFDSVDANVLRALQPRIHNTFWKNRTLVVQVVPERNET